jgi:uncharacterized protein YdeI (YjbR/CyaY-like superfamily)
MGKKDPRIDSYIARSADFAKPILTHLRKLVHAGCPEVEETIKWGFPHFMYKGILGGMGAFKNHCTFGFWRGALIVGKRTNKNEQAMGQLGRITTLSDLPADKIIIGYVKKAVELHDAGIEVPKRVRPARKKKLNIPPYFKSALRKNKKALRSFEEFSPSHKKEYVEWLTEAKTEETRTKRLKTAVEWITRGKSRNWKYVR